MATLLKQSTAETIEFGPFVDKTDGDTEETALSLVTADILVSKNHAALTAKSDATNPTGGTNGHYQVTLDATDTGTLGRLRVYCHKTGALAVWEDFEVVPANVYDSWVAGTDTIQADLTQMGGVAQSATDLKDFADAGYDPATNKVQGVVLCDTTTTNTDMVGTDSAALASVCTESRLAELDAANLPTDVAAIPTTAMRGTDNAATAADLLDKLGAVNEAAAAGDPSATESVIQYVKQIVNILVGTAGVTTYPAEAAPANAVSLAEVIRAIHVDVTGIAGSAMRGTDSAATATNLATVDTVVDAIKAVTDLLPDAGALTTIGTDTARLTAVRAAVLTDWINGGRLDLLLDAIPTTAMRGTDSAALATALATAQADLDTITGTGGVLLGTAQTAAWASALEASAGTMKELTVDTVTNTHTPTTTEFQADDETEATGSHLNDRVIIFTSGALQYQATDITGYSQVGGIGQFTVTAMTEAPANNDTFIIV